MTVDEDREKEWMKRNAGKVRPRVDERLPVRLLVPAKPPACAVCGWPLAARSEQGDSFCARCEHRMMHAPGCGCYFAPR